MKIIKKPYVIAELAWGHDGSVEKAIAIASAASTSGADAFSIHVTELEDYMVKHYGSGEGRISGNRAVGSVYKYLESINLPPKNVEELGRHVNKIGLDLIVMPNDLSSLNWCEKRLDVKAYVLSAASFNEAPMVDAIADLRKPVFLRIGGASISEIDQCIQSFRLKKCEEITLLHGYQNYPTAVEDTDLSVIPALHSLFGVPVGLADHCDADLPVAQLLPSMAVLLGATVIEKHITLDRSEKGEDFEAALNPDEFANMVTFLRQSSESYGSADRLSRLGTEQKYRSVSRKRIVAARDLHAGEKIANELIAFKRSDEGADVSDANLLIGRRLKASVRKDEGIDVGSVE